MLLSNCVTWKRDNAWNKIKCWNLLGKCTFIEIPKWTENETELWKIQNETPNSIFLQESNNGWIETRCGYYVLVSNGYGYICFMLLFNHFWTQNFVFDFKFCGAFFN